MSELGSCPARREQEDDGARPPTRLGSVPRVRADAAVRFEGAGVVNEYDVADSAGGVLWVRERDTVGTVSDTVSEQRRVRRAPRKALPYDPFALDDRAVREVQVRSGSLNPPTSTRRRDSPRNVLRSRCLLCVGSVSACYTSHRLGDWRATARARIAARPNSCRFNDLAEGERGGGVYRRETITISADCLDYHL